ncbi:MAG: hypothetical protein ACI81L_002462 [Verrucomicrobiales bacterium]|jgi:hypothetical protein
MNFGCDRRTGSYLEDARDGGGIDGMIIARLGTHPSLDRSSGDGSGCLRKRLRIGRVDLIYSLVQQIGSLASMVGGSDQQRHNVAICNIIEQRQDLMADSVSKESCLSVGRVGEWSPTQVSAHGLGVAATQRQDWSTVPWLHCTETDHPGTSNQVDQDRLGLVVGAMTSGRVGSESDIPCRAHPRFEIRAGRHVDRDGFKTCPYFCSSSGHVCGFGFPARSLPMIDVHGRDVA